MNFLSKIYIFSVLPFAVFSEQKSIMDSASAPVQAQQPSAFSAAPSPAQPENNTNSSLPTIAVMDFGGRNVTAAEAGALADRFRNEITNTNKLSVMEREQMYLILKEQAFQQTGCVDQSCAVEAGQLIAVTKIITGTVAKVGGIYTVNVKEMDVATGKVDQNISEDCDCPIEKVLLETLHRIAYRIAGLKVEERKTGVEVQRGDASLFVKTEPPDASVYIDGKLMDGRTPVTLENLNPGKHKVMVKKTDMQADQDVELISNQVGRVSMTLEKLKTVLKIASNPSEAETFLDRRRALNAGPGQLSPAIFYDIKPGAHRVSLFKVGYADTSLSLDISEYENKYFSIDLRQITDDKQIIQQKKFVSHRKGHSVARILLVSSAVTALAGGGLLYLAQQDYKTALDAKNRLDAGSIGQGPEWDNLIAKNKSAHDAGDLKSYSSYGLLGATGVLFAIGLVLYF
jgi:hypothetical protein